MFEGLSDAGLNNCISIPVCRSAKKDENSIIEALQKAQQLKGKGQPVVIDLGCGVYEISTPIVLDESFSGCEGSPIILRSSDPQNPAVLSGSVSCELHWERYDENIIRAKLNGESFERFFVNDEPQIRARYPNFDNNESIYNGYSKDALEPSRISSWRNPKGGVIHAQHASRWGGMHYEIIGKNSEGELITRGGWQNNRPSPMHREFLFVENIFEELDSEGEWYFDSQECWLYFYPPQNLDISKATFSVSRVNRLFELRGKEATPVQNLVIENIQLKNTGFSFMATDEPLLRGDWCVHRGGAILIENAKHCQINNCDFHNIGGNAITLSRYCRYISVRGNRIEQIGAGGINVIGDPRAVRSPCFSYSDFIELDKLDYTPGPKANCYPKHCTVEQNLIHDIGLVEKQVAGVQLSMCSHITVKNNSIYRVPRAGINVNDGTWGGHVIEHNDVFDTVLETHDHGAFNGWGRDRFWQADIDETGKRIKDCPDIWQLDAVNTITIRNNRFQCDHGWDIDLDDGCSNYDIYNNITLSGGIKLREGMRRLVYNNILLNSGFHPHVWFENSQDVFERNIVVEPHQDIRLKSWGSCVDYNFFTDEQSLLKMKGKGVDLNSISGDPLFLTLDNQTIALSDSSPVYQLGFNRFDFNDFGVTLPRLSGLAEKPVFADIDLRSSAVDLSQGYDYLDAKCKNVETMGELSSLGLEDLSGVIVLDFSLYSKWNKVGFRKGDVILRANTPFESTKIGNIQDLIHCLENESWQQQDVTLSIFRNQNEIRLNWLG